MHPAYDHFIERRMAPLSHSITGVVLPHEHYGSQLDSNGKTTDIVLEKKNFRKSGEVLVEL